MSSAQIGHRYWVFLALVLLVSACSNLPDPGPVLVEEITLVPTVITTPRSATPPPEATRTTATPTITVVVEEPDIVTDAVLITPTLPPTKSPTPTTTATATSTFTATATWTASGPFPTATFSSTLQPTAQFVPGQSGVGEVAGFPSAGQPGLGQTPQTGLPGPPVIIAGTPGAPVNTGGGCLYFWFFSSRGVPYCPAGPQLTSQAAFLEFENGQMLWFGVEQAIYVLYLDSQAPRWERYQDTWQEGMPERDPSIVPPFNLWQPRRGFGEIWRTNPVVRSRLGWALDEWELVFDGVVQRAGAEGSGTVFFSGPEGRAYQLNGDQTQWQIFVP